MPSSRPSPDVRPRSPLSPQLNSAARFEPLRPSSPRNIPGRGGNANTLKLPSLPRFHPAQFTSAQVTPEPGQGSLQAPVSPRMHQRVISDAQKHLYAHQREMMSMTARSLTPTQLDNPECPRLVPLGSPGPVTPLELESEGGDYLLAGTRSGESKTVAPEELIERLVREETARQWRNTPRSNNR